ncbi:MAG: hypothetical protein ACE5I7_19170 [Candidatus Binatia bacterium]
MLGAARKTRERGVGWLGRRLEQEFRTPSTGPGKALRQGLVMAEGAAAATLRAGLPLPALTRSGRKRMLYFFYDLDVCPVTYDIASYLAVAELERRRRGLRSLHVVVVPGRRLVEEEDDYQAVIGPAARRVRLSNMVPPILGLLPACTGYTVCSSRGQAAALRLLFARHIFPRGYSPAFPVYPDGREVRERARQGASVFPMFRAGDEALRAVKGFLEPRARGRRVVAITLREYGYMPARNSDLASWTEFADGLDPDRYTVVFVRDTSRALEPAPSELRRHILFDAASWNVGLRMALYELAYLNLAIMHGPMELCWYNEACRYLLFIGLGTAPQTMREALIRSGFDIGRSLPFARDYQRWIWESDDLPVIRREFAAMERLLDSFAPAPHCTGAGTAV